ncbi:TPA: glycoside hydrolase family 15 protein, partial [Escherichia coli]|nr:glycoside hydrolase family 15 protein [Escherichia coli]
SISGYVQEAFQRTRDYWREWVRYLSIPLEWQDAVIRSAITLKLCQYEDSGAIIAAMTTSIPEAPGSVRNWDYRYCWLRDAAFVVRSLNRLGATRTMEQFLGYIFNLATTDGTLQPLYGIGFEAKLDEDE